MMSGVRKGRALALFSLLLLLPHLCCCAYPEPSWSACQTPEVKQEVSRLLAEGYRFDEKLPTGLQLSLRKGDHVVGFPPCEDDDVSMLTSSPTESLRGGSPVFRGDPVNLVPIYLGNMMDNQTVKYEASCFAETALSFALEKDPQSGEDVATVTIMAQKPHGLLCEDLYLIANREWVYYIRIWYRGTHTLTLKKWREHELEDVKENGIHMFHAQEGAVGLVRDAMFTKKLFGPKPAKKVKAFLQNHMGMTFVPRKTKRIDIDEKMISSGDIFAINRFSGSDMFIMYGTGSHIGHVAMALWMGDKLYIVESIGSESGWPQHGVIKTPYKDWVDQAEKIGYMVAWLPLDDRRKDSFDAEKAIKRFNELEGLPYGGHNFFFGWVDVPEDNFPNPLSLDAIYVALPIFEKMQYNLTKTVVGEALNKRFPKPAHQENTYMTIADMYKEMDNGLNIGLGDLIVMPEKDEWVYSNGQSVVCSGLVAQLWVEGGAFQDLDIQGNEFHPKDTYQVQFFKSGMNGFKDTRPEQCQVDRLLPYCQILGEYRLDLPGFNTIEPYNNMNEKCPTLPPDYFRPDRC